MRFIPSSLLVKKQDLPGDYVLFSTYFFHFAHMLLSMAILLRLAKKSKRGDYNARDHAGIVSGASYWHIVDLLWIVLFPLIF